MTARWTTSAALTSAEAARLMSVSVSTVRAMVRTGALQATRTPGGHRRISLESIDGWLRARATPIAASEISVVPDDPDDQLFLSILLVGSIRACETESASTRPCDVVCYRAADGLDALIQAARVPPDVLVTDQALGLIDGLEIVRRLRRYPEFAGMIAIVFADDRTGPLIEGDLRLPGVLVMRGPPGIDWLSGLVDALRLTRGRAGSATDRYRTHFGPGQKPTPIQALSSVAATLRSTCSPRADKRTRRVRRSS